MATETLRPNAAGDESNLSQYPASGSNYDKVDEETADDDTTYVYRLSAVAARDLYNLTPSSGDYDHVTIDSVTAFFKCRKEPTGTAGYAKVVFKQDGTVHEGQLQPLIDNWGSGSLEDETFTTNPIHSRAWAWTDFPNLQVGIWLRGTGTREARCTQLYLRINFAASVYPSDDVARVSSIRHIFQPGLFRMQVGLGDLGFDTDVAEAAIRKIVEAELAEPEKWVCPYCGTVFPSAAALWSHVQFEHLGGIPGGGVPGG